MTRRYWCFGFAVLLTAAPLSAQQAGDACSNQRSAEKSAEAASNSPTPITSAIDRIADELAETRKDQTDPYGDERNKREKRDIVAQEESAKWARWNFLAIVLQTLLAAGALAALLYDVGQSRRSAETQSRAYVTVKHTRLLRKSSDVGHKKWFVDIDMDNKGQTPARLTCFTINVARREKNAAPDKLSDVFHVTRNIEVVISSNNTFYIEAEIEGPFNPEALYEGDELTLWGKIDYLDIFDDAHSTTYSLYADEHCWPRGEKEISVHTAMTGNNFT